MNLNQQVQQQQGNFEYVYRQGNFSINTSTSLPTNTSINFKIQATVLYNYDNSGTVTFNSEFAPKKNGYNINYTQSDSNLGSSTYCDTFTTFSKSRTYTTDVITINTSDDISGTFNYQLNFTDVSDQCSCPTNGDATFSINIIDISLNGGNCETVSQSVSPVSSEISAERCEQAPTQTPTITPTPTITRTQTPNTIYNQNTTK